MKGYNPTKPGRPSHVVHTSDGRAAAVLGAEVQAGNESASSHAQPGFWHYFDSLPPESRPVFLRGDIGWGTERMMQEAEQRDQAYLFKIKQSARIKELLAESFELNQWQAAGQGWEGMWSQVRLAGWSSQRRVIILRRPLREDLVVAKRQSERRAAQMELAMGWVKEGSRARARRTGHSPRMASMSARSSTSPSKRTLQEVVGYPFAELGDEPAHYGR